MKKTIRERIDSYIKDKYDIDPEILCVKPKDRSANNPAPDGMEQLSDIVARTGDFVESIRDECSLENVLISTHAIAMKGILEYLDKNAGGKYWSKNIGNCEIYKVDCTDGVYGTPESIYKIP